MTITLTAAQILAITLDQPERLFSNDLDAAHKEYRQLAQRWHPDRNHDPRASDVIAHVNLLYDRVREKIAKGVWQLPGLLKVKDVNGREYQVRYKVTRPFELGDVYIGDRIVVYSLRKEFNDLAANARNMIRGFRFADDAMRAEARRYLPTFHDQLLTTDGTLLVLQKDPDYLCLRDVAQYINRNGKFDPRHVAWVMSRLHNLLCYFEYAGIAHNDISLDSYFISPGDHTGTLIGGWWYACREGQKMQALPERTLRYAPVSIVDKKLADRRIDSELIRAVGRELLGDAVGSKLTMDKDVPKPMADWLRSPGTANAYDEYDKWYNKILPKAFGPRRFVRMEVTSGLYEEGA